MSWMSLQKNQTNELLYVGFNQVSRLYAFSRHATASCPIALYLCRLRQTLVLFRRPSPSFSGYRAVIRTNIDCTVFHHSILYHIIPFHSRPDQTPYQPHHTSHHCISYHIMPFYRITDVLRVEQTPVSGYITVIHSKKRFKGISVWAE